MKLGRFLLAMMMVGSLVGVPVLRANAEDSASFERAPSAAKKKKKKAKKPAKKHAAKKKSKRAARAAAPARSHAAPSAAASPGPKSHYPTQPGGSGFSDIPNEKKDDLPPPQNPDAPKTE